MAGSIAFNSPMGGMTTFLPDGGGAITHNYGSQQTSTDPFAGRGQAQGAPFAAYAPSAATMYGSYADMMKGGAQTLGQMFGAYGNAFGQYGNALAGLGTADANANANRYGAMASGMSGYNNMLGSLGAGALAAYGSASNAALQSQAMRETAYAKSFADALAANQAAMASYGQGRESALAAMGRAYGDTAGQLGAARGNVANAAANLGGAGSTALANLGTGLGASTANVAGNAMNYTRDMAKLDLGRTLGMGQLNVNSQLNSNLGGGNVSISGPDGLLGQGSYGGAAGSSTGQAPAYMNPTPTWYSSPQYYDGGGMNALAAQGNAARQGILGSLAAGSQAINDQTAGMANDAERAFGGIDASRRDVTESPILNALTSGYESGTRQMRDIYNQGRQDPSQLLRDVYAGTQGLAQPFLSAGQGAWSDWMRSVSPQRGGSSMQPYLDALRSGWSNVGGALGAQNAGVLASMTSGQSNYNNSLGTLTNQYGGAMDKVFDVMGYGPSNPANGTRTLPSTWPSMDRNDRYEWLRTSPVRIPPSEWDSLVNMR